ncbi:hypothetical protein MESS4_660059 [Mesorhizobium sp. STM 4661]|nr:hypothetical protein MESS4_660059 [Mesorhizobium sp. STM 4661]
MRLRRALCLWESEARLRQRKFAAVVKLPKMQWFRLAIWYAQGESNPCYRRERAVS